MDASNGRALPSGMWAAWNTLKEEIRLKIIHPLTHAELYQAYGKSIGGGILLYGPPGCGKTYLARATAGEVKADFLAVGINDILDMWIGQSERNLHEMFEQARGHGLRAVLRRGRCPGRQPLRPAPEPAAVCIINQFLAELDGVQSCNEGRADPGGDERSVAPRSGLSPARAASTASCSCRRPTSRLAPPSCASSAAASRVQEIDYDNLGEEDRRLFGADLKAVVDQAIEQKLREAMKEAVPKPLTTRTWSAAVAADSALHQGVVRHGPQLCPVLQSGRHLR